MARAKFGNRQGRLDSIDTIPARQRIGIYGGTFDPIHNAHIAMAETARIEKCLDQVLFVVSARPPHKTQEKPGASPEERFEMVRLALEGRPGLEVSRIELDRSGLSYTADTLEAIHAQRPHAVLYLIIGMDSLADLPHWRHHRHILERARILAIPRPGQWNIVPSMEGHYEVLPFHEVELSSTDVRQRIQAGGELDSVMPEPVIRYIRERRLYAAVP